MSNWFEYQEGCVVDLDRVDLITQEFKSDKLSDGVQMTIHMGDRKLQVEKCQEASLRSRLGIELIMSELYPEK